MILKTVENTLFQIAVLINPICILHSFISIATGNMGFKKRHPQSSQRIDLEFAELFKFLLQKCFGESIATNLQSIASPSIPHFFCNKQSRTVAINRRYLESTVPWPLSPSPARRLPLLLSSAPTPRPRRSSRCQRRVVTSR